MSGRMALHEYPGPLRERGRRRRRALRPVPRRAPTICDGIVVWAAACGQRGARRCRPRGRWSTPTSRSSMLYARRHEVLGRRATSRSRCATCERRAPARRAWFVCGPAGADVARRVPAGALPGRRTGARISTARSPAGRSSLDAPTPTWPRWRPPTSAARCWSGTNWPADPDDLEDGRRLLGQATARDAARPSRRGATSSSRCAPQAEALSSKVKASLGKVIRCTCTTVRTP